MGWQDAPSSILSELVGDFEAFCHNSWQKRPHVHHGSSEFMRDIFSPSDADALLESPLIRPPYLDITNKTKAIPEKKWTHMVSEGSIDVVNAPDVNRLADEFAQGSSIYFNSIDDFHNPARACCHAIQAAFYAVTRAVGIVTPPNNQGLGVHFDAFEGFVLQTYGSKRWTIYPRTALPVHSSGVNQADLGEPVMNFILQAGDCLYVPWGFPHLASSEDDVSCHVTIMAEPWTWYQFLQKLLSKLIPDRARDEVIFNIDPRTLLANGMPGYIQGLLSTVGSYDFESELIAQLEMLTRDDSNYRSVHSKMPSDAMRLNK
jgi:ribosomal protein L16 Arg81 hydroxylase